MSFSYPGYGRLTIWLPHLLPIYNLILAGLILTACATGPGGTPATLLPGAYPGPLTIEVTPQELVLHNTTTRPIYYAVYPAQDLPLIEWAPCDDPNQCPDSRIEPGREVRLAGLTFEPQTREVAVFWWYLAESETGRGYEVSELSEIRVMIR